VLSRRSLSIAALSSILALAPAARGIAQDAACHVAVSDLTVDDQAPPEQYRDMLAAGIAPTVDPILACYRERSAARPGLAGTVRLRLWVSARQVIRVTQEESTLTAPGARTPGDPQLEQCAAARIREFRLPPAAPEGGARVRFTLRFETRGTVAAASPGSSTTPQGTAATGTTTRTTTTTTTGTATTGASTTAGATSSRATVRLDSIPGGLPADLFSSAIPVTLFDQCPAGAGTAVLRVTLRAQRLPAVPDPIRATITVTLSR
jgi:hypothetical protein